MKSRVYGVSTNPYSALRDWTATRYTAVLSVTVLPYSSTTTAVPNIYMGFFIVIRSLSFQEISAQSTVYTNSQRLNPLDLKDSFLSFTYYVLQL